MSKIPTREDRRPEIKSVIRLKINFFLELMTSMNMGIRRKIKIALLSFKLLILSIENIVEIRVKRMKNIK
jgi:hypothetical protein